MAHSESPSSEAGPHSTPERILGAAEALFARDGIDRVTLRQIARDSGQRNVAAVQYHFGDKEALLARIVERHQRAIDTRRRALLEEQDTRNQEDTLGDLLHVLVMPLVEKLGDASGRAYLCIQAQRLTRDGLLPATRDLARRITRSVDAPAPDRLRDRFVVLLLFQALADRCRAEDLGSPQPRSRAAFARSLVRALHGLYAGPPA